MTYAEKLKDPRWQKKRLEIFNRDDWMCQFCGEKGKTLAVHHIMYQSGKDPWDHSNDNLLTLCESCHHSEFELRKEAEGLLIETLKVFRFTASDVYELRDIIGRHMPSMQPLPGTPADLLTLIDRMLCWRKADEKRTQPTT